MEEEGRILFSGITNAPAQRDWENAAKNISRDSSCQAEPEIFRIRSRPANYSTATFGLQLDAEFSGLNTRTF
jgi:hypothetical protein